MQSCFSRLSLLGLLAAALILAACSSSSSSIPTRVVEVSEDGGSEIKNLSDNMVFKILPGEKDYVYEIKGFGPGDQLSFPSSVRPTVWNDDYKDGEAEIRWSADGRFVRIILTGLSEEDDEALYSIPAFKDLFGPNSITSYE